MLHNYAGAAVNTHGGVIKPADFNYWLRWMRKNGIAISPTLTASELYTNKFNPYASSATS